MKPHIMAVVLFLLPCAVPAVGAAEQGGAVASVQGGLLKTGVTQPYIVKPGDTLWDIANHFFRDPRRWLEIWERNLYITNPDLIYPGRKIWFDARGGRKSGGLTTVRPHPEVVIRPVQREDHALSPELVLGALARQDLITVAEEKGVGYILDARDGRLHFGRNDIVYVRLQGAPQPGERFDIFRKGDRITTDDGRVIGLLTNHLGQLQILSESDGVYRAKIVRSFEEISRGDFLKPARTVNARIFPVNPPHEVAGKIIHIRDNAVEAGQNQIVAIDIGRAAGVTSGTRLQVFQKGRVVEDRSSGARFQLPSEAIATLVVISPQQAGSLALVTKSSRSINIGDAVRGAPER